MERAIPKMETIRTCCRLTGLSYWYISNLVKNGVVKHIRSGNRVYVNLDHLVSLLEGGVLNE